jgi:hypothetical protein
VEKKKRVPRMVLGLPVWAWAMLALMLVVWVAVQCAGPSLLRPQ